MSSATEPLIVYAPERAPQPWRNGGGQTRELLLWPADPDSWRLRVSVARIDRSGPFSAFPGVERWFCVLDGAGVILSFGSRILNLEVHSEPLCFDGGDSPDCRLVDGPTHDLNLMCRGGRGTLLPARSGLAWHSPAQQRGLFTRVAGIWHDALGKRIDLAADTLLWNASSAGPMMFEGRGAAEAPVGYWLAYHPEDA